MSRGEVNRTLVATIDTDGLGNLTIDPRLTDAERKSMQWAGVLGLDDTVTDASEPEPVHSIIKVRGVNSLTPEELAEVSNRIAYALSARRGGAVELPNHSLVINPYNT